jgi:drug/metabolite transporter (DMT)-like permease
VGALVLASLSIVQAVLAGGIVLLAVIAERFFGFGLSRRQWLGIGLSAVGLALLAITGEARTGDHSSDFSVLAMIIFESVLVAAGTGLILCYRMPRMQNQLGVLLAVACGLLFTVTHVAVKAVTGLADGGPASYAQPYLLLAVACAVVAFFASARSLQIGPAVPVIAVTSIAGNASSIPAGIIVFGDPLGHDELAVAVRTFAFLLVVAAAALIPAPMRAARAVRRQGEQAKRESALAPAGPGPVAHVR